MNRNFTNIFSLLLASLLLNLFVACGPAVLPATETPTALPTLTASPTLMVTETPTCDGLCPSDSMTATAAMGATLDAIPTFTPPAGVTIIPSAGDLGWGAVYGKIVDAVTGLPLEGATVKCEHFSYASQYLCNAVTTTNSDGIYSFTPVFFHDTDKITLLVEAPGYTPLHFEQSFFTRAEFHADLGLFPATEDTLTSTPTPYLMCTAPACEGGQLVCGVPNGCPGGCGTICILPTLTPQ